MITVAEGGFEMTVMPGWDWLVLLAACFLLVPVLAWIRRWREEREWRRRVARPRGPMSYWCLMPDQTFGYMSEDDPEFDRSRIVTVDTMSHMAVTKGDGGEP